MALDMQALELLFVEKIVSPEVAEFKAWLKHCAEILKKRTPDEVAEVALAVGFKKEVVYSILSSFKNAMQGRDPDNCAAANMLLVESACNRVNQMRNDLENADEPDVESLWKSVFEYQTGEVIEEEENENSRRMNLSILRRGKIPLVLLGG